MEMALYSIGFVWVFFQGEEEEMDDTGKYIFFFGTKSDFGIFFFGGSFVLCSFGRNKMQKISEYSVFNESLPARYLYYSLVVRETWMSKYILFTL